MPTNLSNFDDKLALDLFVTASEGYPTNEWARMPKVTPPKVVKRIYYYKGPRERCEKIENEICTLKKPIEYSKKNLPTLKELGYLPYEDALLNGGRVLVCDEYQINEDARRDPSFAKRVFADDREPFIGKRAINWTPEVKKKYCKPLTLKKLKKAAMQIVNERPSEWGKQILCENYDEVTADIVLQKAVLGDIIYG